MGFFESNFGKKQPATVPAEPLQRGRAAPVSAPVQPLAMAAEQAPPPGKGGKDTSGKPGFLKSAFGNPESGELYGTGSNDYETEEQQIKEEKVSANQSLWYFGAFTLLLFLFYLFFR